MTNLAFNSEEQLSSTVIKNKNSILERLISGSLSIIYSKEKKIERWLILLTIFGFLLRLTASLNLGVLADDMLYTSGSSGIMSSNILSTHSNPPLFFYLTDLAYKIFGHTTFASRFWSLIFGTLLIPLIFLITKKFFNKQIALCAAFFVTFSNLLVRMSYTEQSLTALFFIMFGVYFGLEYLEKQKIKFIILSAILFGLGCLTKYSAPFFIVSFLIFFIYNFKNNKEKVFSKKNIKVLLLFILLILIICLPFITFNYLLFKDKGIVDVYFSRVIQLQSTQNLYSSLGGQDTSFFQNIFSLERYTNISAPFKSDILLSLFFLVGIYLLIKKKENRALAFLIIFLAIPFIMQSAGSFLTKHFAFMYFLMAIPAGLVLNSLLIRIQNKKIRYTFLIIIAIFLVLLLSIQYNTPRAYFSESGTSIIKSAINHNINSNDIILLDPRIYTARSMWLASPYHFLNLLQFEEFYQYNQNLSQQYLKPTKVYIVECSSDDCGWGVEQIKDINQSTEELLDSIKNNSELITIAEPKYSSLDKLFNYYSADQEQYRLYSMTLNLNPNLIVQTDSINNFYFTPYMYKNMKGYLFNYSTLNNFDLLIDKIAHIILKLSIVLAVLSVLLILYLLIVGP
jgi:4-amino-4-deoxy-L-arabinose transferase-like glycosyltransferase